MPLFRGTCLILSFAACSVATSAGCVWLFDRPPGRATDPITGVDACTDHYAATAVDGLAGTVFLSGAVIGLGLGYNGPSDYETFTYLGLVALGVAALNYVSALSNDVPECKVAKRRSAGSPGEVKELVDAPWPTGVTR